MPTTPPDPAPDEHYMGLALELARRAGDSGEVPVGAVAVDPATGDVIATGANRRETDADPTAHAEIVCLRAAARATSSWRLTDLTVYVTLEPCPMCAGALLNSRVTRVVFAAPDPKAGACGSLYNLLADPRLNHEPQLMAGVRGEEAARLLTDWFARRRPGPP